MHPSVYHSSIHNCEGNYPSVDEQIKEMWYIYTMDSKETHSTLDVVSIFPYAVKVFIAHLTKLTHLARVPGSEMGTSSSHLGKRHHCDIMESSGNSAALSKSTSSERAVPSHWKLHNLVNSSGSGLHIYMK